jgi:hypothetical protein
VQTLNGQLHHFLPWINTRVLGTYHPYKLDKMQLLNFLSAMLLLVLPATAQFQFFEQMFGGNQHHQQAQPQNMGSDSAWYQQQYEAGEWNPAISTTI